MARFIETIRLSILLALLIIVSSSPISVEVEKETETDANPALIAAAVGDDIENAPSVNSESAGVIDSNCDCEDEEALCHKYVRQLLDTNVIKGKDDFLREFRIKKTCGSDGKLYSTGCQFQCAQINTQGLHRVTRYHCKKHGNKGRVVKDSNAQWRKSNKYPKVKSHPPGEAKAARLETIEKEPEVHPLVCICPRNYFPVCASNGITYGNKCVFECAKENVDSTLTIVTMGDPCKADDQTVL